MKPWFAALGAGTISLAATAAARAQEGPDPQSLASFAPMETQDALVVPTGTLEFQNYAYYQNNPNSKSGPSILELSPTIKIGAFHHVQLDVTAPYTIYGHGTNGGTVGFDGYYQFTDPTPTMPALAVQAGYTATSYGPAQTSTNYFGRALFTQWLGSDSHAPRLDLNVNWTHYTQPPPGSRTDVFGFGIGYTRRLNDKLAFVSDIVHDYLPTNYQAENFIDAGVRYVIGGGWTISEVVGAGFAQNSPAFRSIFVFQKDFQAF
jgi:hypothetical protein